MYVKPLQTRISLPEQPKPKLLNRVEGSKDQGKHKERGEEQKKQKQKGDSGHELDISV